MFSFFGPPSQRPNAKHDYEARELRLPQPTHGHKSTMHYHSSKEQAATSLNRLERGRGRSDARSARITATRTVGSRGGSSAGVIQPPMSPIHRDFSSTGAPAGHQGAGPDKAHRRCHHADRRWPVSADGTPDARATAQPQRGTTRSSRTSGSAAAPSRAHGRPSGRRASAAPSSPSRTGRPHDSPSGPTRTPTGPARTPVRTALSPSRPGLVSGDWARYGARNHSGWRDMHARADASARQQALFRSDSPRSSGVG